MKLFSRWKKRDGEKQFILITKSNNIKTHLIGSKKRLFDNIVGFEDVKALFGMAIRF